MRVWSLTTAILALIAWSAALPAAEPAKPEVKTAPPLAGLPSKPGPHIEGIKALGDNAWLKLPPAAGDPQFTPPRSGTVRSWSPKMTYVPALGGGIMTGEGAHGGTYPQYQRYSDDVVFYDVYANRWIFVYPGTYLTDLEKKIESGEYRVDEKQLGVLVDKDGRPMPIAPMSGHGGAYQSYDQALQRFVFCGSTFTYFFRPAQKIFAEKRREKGLSEKAGDIAFWVYDAAADRFQPLTRAQLGAPNATEVNRLGPHQVLQYVDSRKMHFWPGDKADYWLDLAAMKMTVRPIVQGEPRIDRGSGQHNACYDPKRDRVYVGGGGINDKRIKDPRDNFFYYDVKADRWVKPDPKGSLPVFWGDGEGFANYDTVNDRLVIMTFNHHMKKEEWFIYVYDPDKNEFEKPAAPAGVTGNIGHAFFCPDLNVFLVQMGGGDNAVATTWAWRYKRAPEKK